MAGITGIWSPCLQLSLWQCVKSVTRDVWDTLLYIREGYARSHSAPAPDTAGFNPHLEDVNVTYLDLNEAVRLLRLLTHSLSAQGDKLHRMFTSDIAIDARFSLPAEVTFQPHASILPSTWECPVSAILKRSNASPPRLNQTVPLCIRARVSAFAGEDLPDKWHVEGLRLYLENLLVLQVRCGVAFLPILVYSCL